MQVAWRVLLEPNHSQDGPDGADAEGGAGAGDPVGPRRNKGDWGKGDRFWQQAQEADFKVQLHGSTGLAGRWHRAVIKDIQGV